MADADAGTVHCSERSSWSRTDLTVLQVDTNPELTLRYRVLGLPAMTLFVGGELRALLTGARPRAAIERHVDETLAQLVTRK